MAAHDVILLQRWLHVLAKKLANSNLCHRQFVDYVNLFCASHSEKQGNPFCCLRIINRKDNGRWSSDMGLNHADKEKDHFTARKRLEDWYFVNWMRSSTFPLKAVLSWQIFTKCPWKRRKQYWDYQNVKGTNVDFTQKYNYFFAKK
jgi:hypothetical protein